LLGAILAVIGRTTDVELVARFKEGDREAFAEIVRRHQHRVYSLALRWMRDDQLALDVSQDVFVALFRALPDFRGDAKLSTWVYRVVVNHCKNRQLYRRRRKMDRHESIDASDRDDDAPRRQLASEGPGPDASRVRTDAQRLIHDALGKLDEDQRAIVVLRDIEDRTYEEIAQIMSIPRGTVKSRLHRARTQLAAVLSRQLDKGDVL